MIYSLLPQSLSHNPNWVYFYRVMDFLWKTEVISNIPQLARQDAIDDFNTATREDILLRASRIGWTFGDNFSANWEDDERAERFLKRFIESWIPYCRSYSGTLSLANYMGYLLGMEIRVVQLWSNVHDEWDTKVIPKLFPTDTTVLPENFMLGAGENPFTGEPTDMGLKTITELNNKVPGWKRITEDPVNGWYPTSHFDVYVDLDQVPKSDLQEKTAEDIIAGIFYELADVTQVLRAIVYSYSFTQIVRVASGPAIFERTNEREVPDIPLEWSDWSATLLTVNDQGVASYTGFKTNTQLSYSSNANLDLTDAIILSFTDADMQQWQAVSDALKFYEQPGSSTVDSGYEHWGMDVCYPTQHQACDSWESNIQANGSTWTAGAMNGSPVCFKDGSNMTVYTNLTPCTPPLVYTYQFMSDSVAFNSSEKNYTVPFSTIAQKIIDNMTSTDQGISLLAETYLEAVANSVNAVDVAKRFVTLSDLGPQFEANKQLSL